MDLQVQKKEYLTAQARNVLKRTAQDIIDLSQICHEYHLGRVWGHRISKVVV